MMGGSKEWEPTIPSKPEHTVDDEGSKEEEPAAPVEPKHVVDDEGSKN